GKGTAVRWHVGRTPAEDEIAGKADAIAGEETEVIARVTGSGDRFETAVDLAVDDRGRLDVQHLHSPGVVGMRVGEENPGSPAPLLDRRPDRGDVSFVLGPGVDHPAGIGAVQ